ncbi:Hypothetical protein FKW44_009003 [Caligus rogercresseyi]|uniref:Uncharacterized protein n=1 Tax=Caligus rogercresseyi TaxID=217165 RepID=A0A7T8HF41_CALRO|nr:Hypothetical protein FKW44_009003 [Caligus rogercresseyi]
METLWEVSKTSLILFSGKETDHYNVRKNKIQVKLEKDCLGHTLVSTLQLSNALDASDLATLITYSEFYKNFRIGLGLPTRISSAEERRAVEKAAGLEEEKKDPETKETETIATEDGGHPQKKSNRRTKDSCRMWSKKENEQQPAEELTCLDNKDGTSSLNKALGR